MAAVFLSCWLLDPSDLLSSVCRRRGQRVDLPPYACVGKEATSTALKDSREQKFCISDEPVSYSYLNSTGLWGNSDADLKYTAWQKDCCYCHMPDLLKITLIQKVKLVLLTVMEYLY